MANNKKLPIEVKVQSKWGLQFLTFNQFGNSFEFSFDQSENLSAISAVATLEGDEEVATFIDEMVISDVNAIINFTDEQLEKYIAHIRTIRAEVTSRRQRKEGY